MHQMLAKFFFAAFILCCSIVLCFAQENEGEYNPSILKTRVSMQQCIEIAIQNHPDVKVTYEDRKIAIAKYKYAKAPSSVIINGEIKTYEYVTATSSATSESLNVPGQTTGVALFAGVSASYMLFDPTRNKIQNAAKASIDISKLVAQKSINELVYNVKKSYYSYLMSEESLKMREEILKKNEQKLKLARMLFNSGQRPILDVSAAEVSASEAYLEFEKAKNNKRITRTLLFSSMGISESDNEIQLEDYKELPEIKYSLDDLYKLGEVYYPDIGIIEYQKRVKKQQIGIERAKRFPTVSILFALSYQNKDFYVDNHFGQIFPGTWTPTVNGAIQAKLPIYDGGAIDSLVDTAVSEYNKTVFQEREISLKMKNEIRINYYTLNEMLKQLKMSQLVIENAEKHLKLAKKSYETGAGSQLELQDAQVTVINANIGYISAKYSYLLTFSKLSSLVGLGEEQLCKKN